MAETAIQERTEETNVVPIKPTGNVVMDMISQAVRDNQPMEVIRELKDMAKELAAEAAEREFNAAMGKAQSEMGRVGADATNKQTHSNYATYAALDKAIRPIYSKNGFSISFDEGDTDKPDHIRVLCYVSHSAGFTRTYRKDIAADGKGPQGAAVMTKTHASGAASSYGMRYLLKMIFNVAVGEDDTDGNAPVDTTAIDKDQLQVIRDLIEATNSDVALFCKYYKIEALPDLPATKFKTAKAALEAKRAKQ